MPDQYRLSWRKDNDARELTVDVYHVADLVAVEDLQEGLVASKCESVVLEKRGWTSA